MSHCLRWLRGCSSLSHDEMSGAIGRAKDCIAQREAAAKRIAQVKFDKSQYKVEAVLKHCSGSRDAMPSGHRGEHWADAEGNTGKCGPRTAHPLCVQVKFVGFEEPEWAVASQLMSRCYAARSEHRVIVHAYCMDHAIALPVEADDTPEDEEGADSPPTPDTPQSEREPTGAGDGDD